MHDMDIIYVLMDDLLHMLIQMHHWYIDMSLVTYLEELLVQHKPVDG